MVFLSGLEIPEPHRPRAINRQSLRQRVKRHGCTREEVYQTIADGAVGQQAQTQNFFTRLTCHAPES